METKDDKQTSDQTSASSPSKVLTPISLHGSVDFEKSSPLFKPSENTNLNGKANGTGSHTLHRSYSTPVLNSKGGKRKYETDFLLSFRHRPECKELPNGISQMPSDIIVDAVAQSRTPQASRNNNTPKTQSYNQQNQFQTKGSGRGGKISDGKSGHKRASSSGGKSHKREPSLSKSQELPPVAPLVTSDNRWIRPKNETETAAIFRKAQGILNKLTIEFFDPLSTKLLNLGITNLEILNGIIDRIFDKALQETHFSAMYAVLCVKLSVKCPNFVDDTGKSQTFRRILLNKCQAEFERPLQIAPAEMEPLEKEEFEWKQKKRALGNIRFIGELFKEEMLPHKIMHECIKSLIKDMDNSREEVAECLLKLITTVGKEVEVKSPELMEDYFVKLKEYSANTKYPSRLRYLAKDVIELRVNNWVPRRKENEAKTLAEARAEVHQKDNDSSLAPPPSPSKSLTPRRSESRDNVGGGSQDIRNTESKLKKSLPRSYSDNSLAEKEFEAKARGPKYQEKKPEPTWDVKGPPKKAYGIGRGTPASPSAERYVAKGGKSELQYAPKAPKILFSADESAPKSALRTSRDSPAVQRKEVTIKLEEEPDENGNVDIEKLAGKVDMLLEEYLSSAELEEATSCLEELKAPDFHPIVIKQGIQLVIEKRERDREEIIKLFKHWLKNDVLKVDDFAKGISLLLETIAELDVDTPFASKFLSTFIGTIISMNNSLELSYLDQALDHLVESGKAAQIIVNILNTMLDIMGEESVSEAWKISHLDIAKFLPTQNRTTEFLSNFYVEKGLSFLEPKKE